MIKTYLLNYCDYHVGFNPKRFKLAAYMLHLMGCNYWFNSIDYKVS